MVNDMHTRRRRSAMTLLIGSSDL